MRTSLILVIFLTLSQNAFAFAELASSFTLDGQLFQAGSSKTLLDPSVRITIQVLDHSKHCVLYEETQVVNTTASDGRYNLQVGSETGAAKRGTADPGLAMASVYQNTVPVAATSAPGETCAGGQYSPQARDARYLRVIVTPSSTQVADILKPDTQIGSVPQATVAETLQGYSPSQFLILGAADLTQQNLQDVFATGNTTKLISLLAHDPATYVRSAVNGALPLPSVTGTPLGASTGQIWYDSGIIKYWDGSAAKSLAAGSGIDSLIVGTGLTTTQAPITSGGQTLSVNVGTGAGQIPQLDGSARLPMIDGSQLTGILASGLAPGVSVTTTGTIAASHFTSQTLGVNTANLRSLVLTNTTAQSLTIQPPAAITGTPVFTWPGSPGFAGQVLQTDGAGILTWGSLSTSLPPSGTAGGDLFGNYPNPTVVKLQGVDIANTAPAGTGQALRYSGTQWAPGFIGMQDLRSNTTGSAQLGTDCLPSQTLTYSSVTDTLACQNISIDATQVADVVVKGGQTGAVSLGSSDSNALNFLTAGTSRMVVSPTGYVAIRTNLAIGSHDPTQKLDFGPCSGSAPCNFKFGAWSFLGTGQTGYPFYGFGTVWDGSQWNTTHATMPGMILKNDANGMHFSSAPANTTNATLTNLLSISNAGNVGIGTVNPSYKLNVTGALNATSIYVNGTELSASGSSSAVPAAGGGVQTISQTSTNSATGARSALILQNNGTSTTNEYNLIGRNASGTTTFTLSPNGSISSSGSISAATSLITPIIYGSTASSGSLTLESTTHATKGPILLAPNGGNVGIGTAAPNYLLDLQGSFTGTARSMIYLTNTDTSATQAAGVTIRANDSAGTLFTYGSGYVGPAGYASGTILHNGHHVGMSSSGASGYIHFMTGPSTPERMRIDHNGNVGIGTTGPGAKLDVTGTIRSFASNNIISIEATDGSGGYGTRLRYGGSGTKSSVFQIQGVSDIPYLTVGGSNPSHIGIGTTNPTEKLAVSGDGWSTIMSEVASATQYPGFVGQRSQGTRAAPTAVAQNDILTTFNGVGYSGTGWNQAANIQFIVDGGVGSGDMPGRISFLTTTDGSSTPTEKVRISNTGNVGIGTTTPITTLHVVGTQRIDRHQESGNGGYLNLSRSRGTPDIPTSTQSGDNAGTVAFSSYDGANYHVGAQIYGVTDGVVATGSAPTALSFNTGTTNGGAPRIRITSAGDVGIGTTNPTYKLDVNGSVNATSIFLNGISLSATGSSASIGATGGSVQTITQTGSNSATAARSALTLQNNGTSTTNEYNIIGKNASGTTTFTLSPNGSITSSGSISAATSLITPVIYGSTASSGSLTLDSTTHATKGHILLAPNGGNVGIGTTAPSYLLDLQGSFTGTARSLIYLNNTDTSATQAAGVTIRSNDSAGNMFTYGSGYTAVPAFAGGTIIHNANQVGLSSSGASGYVHFMTGSGNTERMRVSQGGNIGIGTPNPEASLHILSTQSNANVSPNRAGIILESEGTNVGGRYAARVWSSTEVPYFQGYRAGGTKASPTAVIADQSLSVFEGIGYDGTNWKTASSIRIKTAENWNSSANGSSITFHTVNTGATSQIEAMRINSAGYLGIGTVAPTTRLHVESPDVRFTNGTRGLHIRTDGTNSYINNMDNFVTNGSSGNGLLYLTGQGGLSLRYGSAGSSGTEALKIDSTGKVGIGTDTPTQLLHVKGTSARIRVESSGGNNPVLELAGPSYVNYLFTGQSDGGWYMRTDEATRHVWIQSSGGVGVAAQGNVQIGGSGVAIPAPTSQLVVRGNTNTSTTGLFDAKSYSGTSRLFIRDDGNVGIGLTNPTYQLQLSTDSAAKTGTSTWSVASDERLKDIRAPFTRGLNAITGLNTIYFRYKKDNPLALSSEKEFVGIKAQDAQKVIPESVDIDDEGYLHLTNDAIIWTAVNAIKELYSKFLGHDAQLSKQAREIASKADKTEIEALRSEVEAKDQRIKELEQRDAEMKIRLDRIEKALNKR